MPPSPRRSRSKSPRGGDAGRRSPRRSSRSPPPPSREDRDRSRDRRRSSRSRSRSRDRHSSSRYDDHRARSRSPPRGRSPPRRRYSRSRSRSPPRDYYRGAPRYDDRDRYGYDDRRGGSRDYPSRPYDRHNDRNHDNANRPKYVPQRPPRVRGTENTTPSLVLGVFGLSTDSNEASLTELFSKYGVVDRVNIIYDKQTGLSRGFGFLYMNEQEGATKAKEALNGAEIAGRTVRVDYSLTSKPHDSTPGQYMGNKRGGGGGGGGGGRGGARSGSSSYVPRDQREPRDVAASAASSSAAAPAEERRRSRSPMRDGE